MSAFRKFSSSQRLMLICAGLILYANTLFNGYAIDDSLVTKKENITTRGIKVIPELLRSNYTMDESGKMFEYRPLVKVSYALEHQFFGVRPGVSHLFNVLIYILVLLLVYRFLRLFISDANSMIPFYATLLFAFLPIHTEVVASLKNRDILLCFIFCMLSAISVLKANITEKKMLHYALALAFFFLAFLCKFDALPYLLVLPLIVWVRFRVKAKVFFLLLLGFAIMFILTRAISTSISERLAQRHYAYFENPLYFQKNAGQRIPAAFDAFGFYATQCLLPLKQSCYYGFNSVEVRGFTAYGYLGIFLVLLSIFGLVYSYRRNKVILLLGLIMFLCSTSMYLGLIRPAVGIVADRFTFFSSLGFALIITSLIAPYLRSSVRFVAIGLLVVYGVMTIKRNTDWKDSGILIAADVKKYPKSTYLNYLYATAIMDTVVANEKIEDPGKEARVQRIIYYLHRSIEIFPYYQKSLDFISSMYLFMEHDYAHALPYVNLSLRMRPRADTYFYKGLCLKELNQPDSSEKYFLKALRSDSTLINVYGMLMQIYNSKQQYDKSIEMLNGALEKGVENDLIYGGLAVSYLELKDTLSAEFYCQKALTLNPASTAQQILLRIHPTLVPGADSTKRDSDR